MRIESITAHAFGPLAGETLQLAPGLTVVSGVNESAKSSWHAAIYAALCGRGADRREAPGPGPATDASGAAGTGTPPVGRGLVERYRPWDGKPWLLSSVVVLDDGRRLEVCQDLDGGARNRVVEHAEWTTTTIHIDALARAHALAAAMLAAGDDRGLLEPQLVAVGVPAPAAAEACELSRAQRRVVVMSEIPDAPVRAKATA